MKNTFIRLLLSHMFGGRPIRVDPNHLPGLKAPGPLHLPAIPKRVLQDSGSVAKAYEKFVNAPPSKSVRPRSDFLFRSVTGGQAAADNYREVFKPAAIAIGRPEMSPHNCRDTYASWAISLGVPVTAVSKSLGHADASVTLKVYADFFPQDYDRLRTALSGVHI